MTATPRTGWRWYATLLWVVCCAAMGLSTVWYVAASYQPLQWADQWEEVQWLQQWEAGHAHLSELWRLHAEHPILVPRLFYLADFAFAQGTNGLLIPMNVLMLAGMGLAIGRAVWRAPGLSDTLRLFQVSTVMLLLLSAVQMENFYWGFQAAFVLVFGGGVGAFVCLQHACDRAGRGGRWQPWLAASLLCAGVASFSMANGILVWPLLVLTTLPAPVDRRVVVIVATAGAASVCWWALSFHTGQDVQGRLEEPFHLLLFCALYLGAPFHQHPLAVAGRLGMTGLVLAVLATVYYGRRWRTASGLPRILLPLVWYSLGAAVATGLGRGQYGGNFALQLRYCTGALVFWAALIPLLFTATPAFGRWAGVARTLLVVTVVGVSARWLLPSHMGSGRYAIATTHSWAQDTLSLVAGVHDDEALGRILFYDPTLVSSLTPYTRTRRLGIFARPWAHDVGAPLDERVDVGPGTRGGFTAVQLLPPPARDSPLAAGARVSGWVARAASEPPPHRILITDDTGIVRGMARVMPEVSDADAPRPVGRRWEGYAVAQGPLVLSAYAVTARTEVAQRLNGRGVVGPLAEFPSAIPAEGWDRSAGWIANRFTDSPYPFTDGYAFASTGRPPDDGGARLQSPPIATGAGGYLVIPVLMGKDHVGLTVTLEAEGTAEPLAVYVRDDATTVGWSSWVVPLTDDLPATVRIVATDGRTATHAWMAIGEPRRVPETRPVEEPNGPSAPDAVN